MNAIAAWLAKFFAATGGAPVAGALVVVGLVVGGLLGAGAGGAFSPEQPISGALQVYPCPQAGPALTQVPAGQEMLVTGRSADGAWLRIHFPSPGRTEAWVSASAIRLVQPFDSLPIADCQPEVAQAINVSPSATLSAVGSFVPTPSPTPSPTPTSRPTAPPTARPTARPTPRPTARPTPRPTPVDTSRPTITNLDASAPRFYRGTTCTPNFTNVTVTADDPQSGIARVTLYWLDFNGGIVGQARMVDRPGLIFSLRLDAIKPDIKPGAYQIRARAENGAGLIRDSSIVDGFRVIGPCP